MICALLALLIAQPAADAVEPQPLPDGVRDTGINVLLDSSHQFSFFYHWDCQDALRGAGHRVTGNQASLYRALAPGTPMRVRKQDDHTWSTYRPFGEIPAPEYDVVFTYQDGKDTQPYLDAERAALRAFVEGGGGLVIHCWNSEAPLARLAAEYGSDLRPGRAAVSKRDVAGLEGLDPYGFPTEMPVAEFSDEWTVAVGAEDAVGALAWRSLGEGVVVHLVAPDLAVVTGDNRRRPNAELLSSIVGLAAGDGEPRDDDRNVPWEHAGIGGAFYPELEMTVGGVSVMYAENQLADIIELAKTRFTEVMDVLQEMLPTPPNPGDAFYINLAAGNGGGWAENAYTPKLAGTIATSHESILSILAHELAHTMYGPAADDGTPGCSLPGWFSEAHAGWFQRKAMGRLGYGPSGPHFNAAVAKQDPLLDDLDLANIPEGKMGLAWSKAWVIWSILDARYGEEWYPRWLEHVHTKYNDPETKVDMDDYVISVSETVGEDVAPLFERFGATIEKRANLPPIGPP